MGVIGLLGVGALTQGQGPVAAPLGSPIATATPGAATAEPATPSAATAEPGATTAETVEPAVAPAGPTEPATVVRVTDGDTIVVAIDGVEARVRYIGIDTPEPDDADPAMRAMADQATAANAALVEGREVLLERDVSDTDRFDRLLRNVWIANTDGGLLMVGLELVRQGFAQVSTYPPDVRYVDLLLDVQEDARAREVGLWAATPSMPAAEATVPALLVDTRIVVGSADRTTFEGGTGSSTWTALDFEGERATVRWDVRAADADCQVAWRLEPTGGDGAVINSTVRVDAGGRAQDNRRYDIDFEDAAFHVSSTCPAWVMTMQTTATSAGGECDDSYPGVCIPPYPPDLDCGDIAERDFVVMGSDPHGFDREGDGRGCES